MARLVERRANEVVHPRVDHEPPRGGRDLRLDDARDQDARRGDQRPPRLDVEREVAEPPLLLLVTDGAHELRRRDRRALAVVDAEARRRSRRTRAT